jgi:hypothetical protein
MGKISLFMSFLLNKAVGWLSIPPDAVTVTNSRSRLWEFNMEFNEIRYALFVCVQFVSLALAVFCCDCGDVRLQVFVYLARRRGDPAHCDCY